MNDSLEHFVESVNGTGHLRVEQDLGDGYVRLRTSEAERRQAAQDIQCSENIVLELLRNARDAHASHVFVAMSRDGSKRILTVIDDGCGIPPSMHETVFEPRVTSKLDTSHMDTWGLHGRGMALYSIKVNSELACVMSSAENAGCAIRVETDLGKLPEKTDQSSFPTFEMSEAGKVNVRGPKNILRTICEFAIDARQTCSVYVGSPAEIAAALYAYGMATLSTIDRLFCRDASAVPLVKRLALSGDPSALADAASELGLDISERTARRIIDGELADAECVLDRIVIKNAQGKRRSSASKRPSYADMRSLKLSGDDRVELANSVKNAFGPIAQRYYLEDDVEPSIHAKHDRIVITIPVVKL